MNIRCYEGPSPAHENRLPSQNAEFLEADISLDLYKLNITQTPAQGYSKHLCYAVKIYFKKSGIYHDYNLLSPRKHISIFNHKCVMESHSLDLSSLHKL